MEIVENIADYSNLKLGYTKFKKQELYVEPQINFETDEKVLFVTYENYFKNNELNEEKIPGFSRIVFAYETYKIDIYNKKSRKIINRAIVDFQLEDIRDTSDVVEYLKEICSTSDLPINFFNNEDVQFEYLNRGYKLKLSINARIATQEFAFKIDRYAKGKTDECLNSFINALETNKEHTYIDNNGFKRTVSTPAFSFKLNTILKNAVFKTNPKLIIKCTDSNTGLFSIKLLSKLNKEHLSLIMKKADDILFGNSKDRKGIIKRDSNKKTVIRTNDESYILIDNIFIDDELNFEKFPDIFIDNDKIINPINIP